MDFGTFAPLVFLAEADDTLHHRIQHLAPVEIEQLQVMHGGRLVQPSVSLVEELQIERAYPHIGRPPEVHPHVLVAGAVTHHRHLRHAVHVHRTHCGDDAWAECDDHAMLCGVHDGLDRRIETFAPMTGRTGAERSDRHQRDRRTHSERM